MLIFRKILFYGFLALLLGFLAFLTPIFYQTYQFYYTHRVIFPPPVKPAEHTEVYLIGTRHIPTDQYNQDTVYRYLEEIQPDLILLELDSSFLRGDRLKHKYTFVMRFYPFLRKYWNLEMLAATKYAKYHEEVSLAPFEWGEKREIYKDIRSKSRSEMMRALQSTKTDTVNRIFQECGKLYNYSKTLQTLQSYNNHRNDVLMERFVHLEYEIIPSLVLKNDSLTEHHEFARKFKSYWPTRNGHMARNILKAIKQNPDKRIVVLTGYRHRYLLRQLLKEGGNLHEFVLLDYQGKDMTQ